MGRIALRLLLFVATWLSQVAVVSGGTSTVTGHTLTTPEYVEGAAPTRLVLQVQFADGVDTAGDTIKVIFSKALMESAASPVVTVTGANTPVFSGWSTSGGGTIVTGTLSSGSISAETVTITITNSFVGFPSTGVVTATAEAASSNTAGDSTGASFTMFSVIAAPTISLSTGNMYVATIPAQLSVSIDAPFTANTNEILKVTFSEAVFAATQTVSLSGNMFTSYVSDSTGTYVEADAASSISRGTTMNPVFSGSLMTNLPTPSVVTADISLNGVVIAKSVTGFGIILLAAAGTDPIARFGDRELAFELPPDVLTSLVVVPELSIRGSVFQGGGPWEQWFGRIVLSNPEEDRFLEIRMRKNLHEQNHSRLPRDEFHTFSVTMGYGDTSNPVATTTVEGPGGQVPRSFLGYDIAFHRVTRHDAMRFARIGRLPRECAHLAGPTLHFYICSAPASEYYGPQSWLSVKYAHLDMVFLEIKDFKSLTGLLPELWGVQPMSEATRATLLQKEDATNTAVEPTANVTASVGGWGAENITEECTESMKASVLTV